MYIDVTDSTDAPLPFPDVVEALKTVGCRLIGRVEWVDDDADSQGQERVLPAAVLVTAEQDAFVLLDTAVRKTPAAGSVTRLQPSVHVRTLLSDTVLIETIARHPIDPSVRYASLRAWNDLVPVARNRKITLAEVDDPAWVVRDHQRRVALHREFISASQPIAHADIDTMLLVWGLADAHRHHVSLRMGKILRYGRRCFLAAMTVVAALLAIGILATNPGGNGPMVAVASTVALMAVAWRLSRRVADRLVTMPALHPPFEFRAPTSKTTA